MPIYEFLCGCGHRFEKLCKMNDKPFSQCPACGGESRRVMSAFRVGRSAGSAAGSSPAGSSCSGCSSTSCASCH
ncbi:MAG: FmdB family zinc ribbon protein [Dethiobacteria bacterium]|jgi:putative FmdB family regulatory protein